MGIGFRKAGDVFGTAAGDAAIKENIRQGTRGIFGIDQNVVDTAIGVGREIVGGIHPAFGVVDDLVSVGQNANKIDNAKSMDDVGSGIVGLAQTGTSLAGAGLKAAGAKGAASAVGPIGLTALPGIIMAPQVTKNMNDPSIRKPDIEAYKKAFYR